MNDVDTIQKSFEPYYRTTILSAETDPNKFHHLKADLDGFEVYEEADVEAFVAQLPQRRGLRPARSRPRRVPRPLYREISTKTARCSSRGSAKTFTADVRVPLINSSLHERPVGAAFYLPELPRAEAAGAGRGGLLEGHSRHASTWTAIGSRSRPRAPSDYGMKMPRLTRCPQDTLGPHPRARARPPLEYPSELQRALREHRVGRFRPD